MPAPKTLATVELATVEDGADPVKVVRKRAPRREKTTPPAKTVSAADDPASAQDQGAAPPVRGRRKKSDLKQRAILEAAAKVFKNKGYAHATLSEIGKKAGTFAGSMYYYFSSKEELVEEVLNLGTTGVEEVVARVVAALPEGATHRMRIQAAFRAHLNQMLLRDDFIVAYWRIINQVPADVRARHLKKPRGYGDFWRKLIADAAEAGEIRPGIEQTIFRLVLIGSSIYALDWYSPRGGMDANDIADTMLNMVFDGVGNTPPAS